MTYQEMVQVREDEAIAWMERHEAELPKATYVEAGQLHGHITVDSMIADIALAEAGNVDYWEEDSKLSFCEEAGKFDVTGLAHWQGDIEAEEDIKASGIQAGHRGKFLEAKWHKHQDKQHKARAYYNIGYVLDTAGRVRAKMPKAEVVETAKADRIAKKLAKLDRGAAPRLPKIRVKK